MAEFIPIKFEMAGGVFEARPVVNGCEGCAFFHSDLADLCHATPSCQTAPRIFVRAEAGTPRQALVTDEHKAFKAELARLLNSHNYDTVTSTPDWVLADMVTDFLGAYSAAINKRSTS